MTTQEILQGVHDWTNGKIVYDISVAHPDGQGNPTKYADLTAALGTGGANIPEALRKGGMSVKFVLSSDNKYVQHRYMSSSTAVADFTNVANWQGVDKEPVDKSNNVVESNGVYRSIQYLKNDIIPTDIKTSGLWIATTVGDTATKYLGNPDFNYIEPIVVKNGDIYVLWGKGGIGSSRLWAILDIDMKVLEIATSGETYTKNNPLILNITAVNAAYLIASFARSDGSSIYKKDSVYKKINENTEKIDENTNSIESLNRTKVNNETVLPIAEQLKTKNIEYTTGFWYQGTSNKIAYNDTNETYVKSIKINVLPGEKYAVWGKSSASLARLWFTVGSDDTIISMAEPSLLALQNNPIIITIDNDTRYLVVNSYADNSHGCSFLSIEQRLLNEEQLSTGFESEFKGIKKFPLSNGYVWEGTSIGTTVSKKAVQGQDVGVIVEKIPIAMNEQYVIYGKGGSGIGNGKSRLWAIVDANMKILNIATSGETHTLDNPLILTVTESNAAFLVATFLNTDKYGIYKNTISYNYIHEDHEKIKAIQEEILHITSNNRLNILLDGASFAYDENSWFSLLCERLEVIGYNKAVSGESIKQMAQRLHDGTEYTAEEMENFGILMIMHVHNQNVADTIGIEEDYNNYTFPASNLSYSQAYDYVLKRYAADCYALKNNANSKWYGYPMGKPCIIVVLTHWHDARTIFNDSIRVLKDKWGFYLVELDKKIGFSKNQLNPVTDEQNSILYAVDTETIEGVDYGWHPLRTGDGADVIQNRIADICFDTLSNIHH